MKDLDPLLLRAFKAGRAENPDSEEKGKARALAALGLSTTAAEAPRPSSEPAPSGPRLALGARSMLRSPWWTLVFTVFATGGGAWLYSEGDTTPAPNAVSASAAVTTPVTPLAVANPQPPSSTAMTLPVIPESANPSVDDAEAPPRETTPAVVARRAGDGARVSTRSVADLPNAREATVRADAKLAAAPAKPVNAPCPGCDSPSSNSERTEGVGTTSGAGASLREEIEALERASSALSERQCARARRALSAYRSTYPNGKLEREADVVAIEITGRSGDIEGARTAARRFVERFPNSPYSLRLRPWLRPESDPASNIALCVDAAQ